MATIGPNPKFRAFGDDGTTLAGGKVFMFEAGTSTPKNTYQDLAETVVNANPVVLDANGEADIRYLTGLYKIRLEDSLGAIRWTVDNYGVADGTGTGQLLQTANSITELRALTAGSSTIVHVLGYYTPADRGGDVFYWDSVNTNSDDGGITIRPDSAPATGRWIRLYDGEISALKFGALGDYIVGGVVNGSAFDNTTVLNNLFTYCRVNLLNARLEEGTFKCTGALNCAVSIIGDQKGDVRDSAVWGNGAWTTSPQNNLFGSCIIWDKSVLSTTDVYMRNVSGDDTSDIQFKNITFYSLSATSMGGGVLFVNDSSQTLTEYNFGFGPTFENCHIVNFQKAIQINVFDRWNISNIRFVGCQIAILAGNDTPEVAKNITVDTCDFEACGDESFGFMELDNIEGFKILNSRMESTAEINIRKASNQGLLVDGCSINDQTPGASNNFINLVSTSGFDIDNVVISNCQSGGSMGGIDLVQAANISTLSIYDSDLTGATIPLGTENVTINQFGTVTITSVTGTGNNNKFTSNSFQFERIVLSGSSTTRQIKLLDTNQQFVIAASASTGTSDGGRISLKGKDHTSASADIEISAGITTNPGNVIFNAPTTKQVIVTGTDDSSSAITGALKVDGGAGVAKNVTVGGDVDIATIGGGLKIATGTNATVGQGTLSGGSLTIANTTVLTGSLIFLTYDNVSLAVSAPPLLLQAIVTGVSFTVTGNGTESFNWLMINPS